jgi:putative addiction module killer protein
MTKIYNFLLTLLFVLTNLCISSCINASQTHTSKSFARKAAHTLIDFNKKELTQTTLLIDQTKQDITLIKGLLQNAVTIEEKGQIEGELQKMNNFLEYLTIDQEYLTTREEINQSLAVVFNKNIDLINVKKLSNDIVIYKKLYQKAISLKGQQFKVLENPLPLEEEEIALLKIKTRKTIAQHLDDIRAFEQSIISGMQSERSFIEKKRQALHELQESKMRQQLSATEQKIKKARKREKIKIAKQKALAQERATQEFLACQPPITCNPDADNRLLIALQQEEKQRQHDAQLAVYKALNTQAAQEKKLRKEQQGSEPSTAHSAQDTKSSHKETSNAQQSTAKAIPASSQLTIHFTQQFEEWIDGLDSASHSLITARLKRLKNHDFGDARKIMGASSKNVWELRIQSTNPQSRIYYTVEGDTITVLCAGNKAHQEKSIALAFALLKNM